MRPGVLLLLVLLGSGAPTSAQTIPSTGVEFMARAVLFMGAERLASDDVRFHWEANFGGEVDVVDYGYGRVTFGANYQVILGDELRAFDPNQGNYILEAAASGRLRVAELAAVFYHQSRHLSDRAKEIPIDWNMLGIRARRLFLAGATHLEARGDVRGAIQRSFVDYRWELDGRLRADRVLRPGVGVLAGAAFRHLRTDGTGLRASVTGFRAEGGIRFDGGAGAVEVFVAAERRIDPSPLEFGAMTWATAGFRLLTR